MSPSRQKQRAGEQQENSEEARSIILDLARVTRVQKGGKRLRFRATVAIGNKKGEVGVGVAKGADVSIAVEKATRRAKKDIITIPLNGRNTIPHKVEVKFKACHILLKPAPPGTGIKAGGVIRTLCDLAGINDISAKILGSSNKIANAQAVIKAFQTFRDITYATNSTQSKIAA